MIAASSECRHIGAAIAAVTMAFALPPCVAMADGVPQRVVSINLCTDQMAMLVAAEGQLYSVSDLAGDPDASVLAGQASGLAVNHGMAEEIFLMHPDLVLAGTYTARPTVALLRRLGFHVEQFAPDGSFDDMRASLRRMGELLGREQRAAELVAELDAGLAALAASKMPDKTVGLYYANSYTAAAGTLADAIVKASGLANLGDRLGFAGMVKLPLELLVMADPDIVVAGDSQYRAPALARENFVHPAYRALSGRAAVVPDKYTICGAPFTLEAARILQQAARQPAGTP